MRPAYSGKPLGQISERSILHLIKCWYNAPYQMLVSCPLSNAGIMPTFFLKARRCKVYFTLTNRALTLTILYKTALADPVRNLPHIELSVRAILEYIREHRCSLLSIVVAALTDCSHQDLQQWQLHFTRKSGRSGHVLQLSQLIGVTFSFRFSLRFSFRLSFRFSFKSNPVRTLRSRYPHRLSLRHTFFQVPPCDAGKITLQLHMITHSMNGSFGYILIPA